MDDAATNLRALSMLSMVMIDREDEQEILRLAAASVPALTPCEVEACYVVRGEQLVPRTEGRPDAPDVTAALRVMDGAPGPVAMSDRDWVWAYPLNCLPGDVGYIVVSATTEPAAEHRVLLTRLAQQTGAALSRAAVSRNEQPDSRRLEAVNAELATANARLHRDVSGLERQQKALETMTAVAAAGGGEAALATALHETTGLAVAIEDQFGNLLAWAGPDRPQPYPQQSRRHRAELLDEVAHASGPVREHDRLIAVARSLSGVLGVVALIDPARRAGHDAYVALEHAAVVLTIGLAHQRELAAAELRLRGDLVGDLVTGTHAETAVARAAALGHDLRGPHQVLLLRWPGGRNGEALVPATERAARLCAVDALVACRAGMVVMVAARPAAWGSQHQWGELHRALTEVLPGARGCIGVGGERDSPAQLPRSYSEARHALALGQRSPAGGVTSFDELGVLRLLFTSAEPADVDQFVRDWLGILIDYDGAKGAELVETLSQYYDSGGNYDLTAKALRIHRSTLRYRLKRIRELTGHDLGEVDCRLNLEVATRAWHILHEVPQEITSS